MEVAKTSIIKVLITITSLLMLAFIPQINHASNFNHTIIPMTSEKYWTSWYYWHRWRESLSRGDQYCHDHLYHQAIYPVLSRNFLNFTLY